MPTHLPIEEHLDALHTSVSAFRRLTEHAGLRSPVPTCPGWDAHDLIAHQGKVHRWATANLLGEPHRRERDFAEGKATADPLAWFDHGATTLLETLRTIPDSTDALVILADAPPPRPFWARRQAHETTIHATDALACALGRQPTSAEVTAEIPFSTAFAADGVDELLCGFLPIGRSKLYSAERYILVVETTDTGQAWTVRIGPEKPATTEGRADAPYATVSGTAIGLYLGLWNRGDQLAVTGWDGLLSEWRSLAMV